MPFVFYTSAPKRVCIRRLTGARHVITGCVVNTVTRGWVGAPNERAQFRFHDAVVGFVDRHLSGLGISPLRTKHLAEFFQAELGPTSAQELYFSVFV